MHSDSLVSTISPVSLQHSEDRDYPRERTLAELFELQAERTPHACALVCGARSLTFRELDAAANRLARELIARGVAPHTRIVVALDRSLELVIALLAVLKAGSSYVPLDPDYPRQRLLHVVANAQPAAILTRAALQLQLADSAIEQLCVDALAARVAAHADGPMANPAATEDAAYVIYTSGSTGVPKGVAIPHRALSNFLWSMRRRPGIVASDTLLAVTTISFDIHVLEIFLPLVSGARLVLASAGESRDGAALYGSLQRHGATILQATPMTWQLLLEAGWCGTPSLKMLCGGEAMPRKLAEQLLACGGELWNMYGPTETTVWSSALQVTSGTEPVLLGPPIANTQFHVLDAQLQPVPAGEAGELFIGGDGVALGYFAAPELTAQRFLPDACATRPGALWYRTGDLVRARGQCLEYLGRADDQVKLRGFRIELGEIEHTLLRHPEVVQAAATVRPGLSGEPTLCAYVVLRDPLPGAALLGDLRESCATHLPHYMQPTSITVLTGLPRTPNGKIDRRALPAPALGVPSSHAGQSESVARRTLEKRLAILWKAVLGVEHIDASANFFALGGHSVLAARLLRRVEAEFGVRLALAALLAAPTLAQQVQMLMQNEGRHYDFRHEARLHASGSKTPLIAIHNTGVYYYNLAQLLGSDQPLTALQLFDPALARDQYPETVEEIAAEYVRLILQLQPAGPYQLLGWCVGGVLAVEIARQLRQQQRAVSFLGLIDAWSPGYSQRMPPLRRWLAQRSYRLQLVRGDWRRVRLEEQSVTDFLSHRVAFRRLLELLGKHPPAPLVATFANRNESIEHYDRWLDGYLDSVAARYLPQPLEVGRALICSSRENRGWCLDPQLGWDGMFKGEVDVAALEGDHFTVFRSTGLARMAEKIAASLAASPTVSAGNVVALANVAAGGMASYSS
jgi:amino acid adenylation domain-containing protein